MIIPKQTIYLANTVLTWESQPRGQQTLGEALSEELRGVQLGMHLVIDSSQIGNILLSDQPDLLVQILTVLHSGWERNPFCMKNVKVPSQWEESAKLLGVAIVVWDGNAKVIGKGLGNASSLPSRLFSEIVAKGPLPIQALEQTRISGVHAVTAAVKRLVENQVLIAYSGGRMATVEEIRTLPDVQFTVVRP